MTTLYNARFYMKRLAILFVLAASSAFAVPQPYPITVDSQVRSVPSLEMYQAEQFTVRATFKSGGTAEDVSTAPLFMYWAASASATNYVTSSWARVSGGVSGVVDFTFSAAALNTNGSLIYGVGAGSTFRHGALKIIANPYTAGVASPTFTLATNLAGVTFVNYPWIDSVSLYQGNSNHAAVSGNGIVIVVRTNYGGGSITSETDPVFVAASNALLTKVQAASLYATGTPVYAESDPRFVAASNALLTEAEASALYATNDQWAADIAGATANMATGSPIYSISGLATGTPVYTESDPVYVSASTGLLTKVQASALYATGTPLYVESNPSLVALSNDVSAASSTGMAAHLLATLVSNRVAAVEDAGYISSTAVSNIFVKQNGDVLTGGLDFTNGAPARFMNGAQTYWYATGPGNRPYILIDADQASAYGVSNPVINITRSSASISYFTASTNNDGNILGPLARAHGNSPVATNWVDIWDRANLPDPRNLSAGTNAPSDWVNPSLAPISNSVITIGAGTTNAQITASNALVIANGADTDTVAQASIVIIGLQTTNANIVASNAQASVNGLGVVVSNLNPSLWSQTATGNVDMAASYGVSNSLFMGLVPSFASGPRNSLYLNSTTGLVLNTAAGLVTLLRTDNLAAQGVQTVASYNSALTNTLWRWSGFIQGGTGQRGNMYESNGWLYVWSDSSNAYGRVQLSF